MRFVRFLPEIALAALMVVLLAINGVLYSGVLIGEDAINVQKVAAGTADPGQAGRAATAPVADATLTPSERAELDDSADLPGRFVPAQGREHTPPYSANLHVPFCKDGSISKTCYASNPPTSGLHLPVQGTIQLRDGHQLKIPPDPDIFDFPVPREAIPHIEEHAGVYVGYNCLSDDCRSTVERLKDLVAQEISLGARAVMSPDPDLDDGVIGLAAWTRVDTFDAGDYSDERVRRFIKAHSCRFDPEHFCKTTPIN
jgi:hypothetical protein